MSLLLLIVSHVESPFSCNNVDGDSDATESPVTQPETAVYKDEKEDLGEESGRDDVTGGSVAVVKVTTTRARKSWGKVSCGTSADPSYISDTLPSTVMYKYSSRRYNHINKYYYSLQVMIVDKVCVFGVDKLYSGDELASFLI